MIIPVDRSRLLVAHRGALLSVDTATGATRSHSVGSSSLIRFVAGTEGVFAVKHHEFAEPPVRSITAHRVSAPSNVVARLDINDDWEIEGEGEASAWVHLPPLYNLVFPYLLRLTDTSAHILRLPAIPGREEDPEDPYKLVPCPDGDRAIVTSTRLGGRFVVFDLLTAEIRADLTLGYGPPLFRFRDKGREAWLAHLDTIFRIDTTTWTVREAVRLRRTPTGGLISDLHFDESERRCAVAYSDRKPMVLMQPYRMAPVSGRLLVFDVESMEVTHGAPMERWADEVAFLDDDRVAMLERGSDVAVSLAELQPFEFELHPPRDPDDVDWR